MFEIQLEDGSPFSSRPPDFTTLRARLDAANKTLEYLGEDVVVTDEAQASARKLLSVENKSVSPADLSDPATIVHVRNLLSEYDKQIVYDAVQLRNFVTNKLIAEASNPDARIRMKSLELLGKIGDVGLFTERSEVTIRQRPTEEIERMLREKLMKVIDADPVTPVLKATETRDMPA